MAEPVRDSMDLFDWGMWKWMLDQGMNPNLAEQFGRDLRQWPEDKMERIWSMADRHGLEKPTDKDLQTMGAAWQAEHQKDQGELEAARGAITGEPVEEEDPERSTFLDSLRGLKARQDQMEEIERATGGG